MKMHVNLAAIAAVVVLAAPALAADGEQMNGRWTGGYIAETSGDANTFEFVVTARGRAFTGEGVEVNAIGDRSVLFLTSTMRGEIEPDGRVSFVKTYDGSGGVSHSVTYVGQLDATGRRIRGRYDAGGAGGEFEMVR